MARRSTRSWHLTQLAPQRIERVAEGLQRECPQQVGVFAFPEDDVGSADPVAKLGKTPSPQPSPRGLIVIHKSVEQL